MFIHRRITYRSLNVAAQKKPLNLISGLILYDSIESF